MARLSRLVGTVVGSMALAAVPTTQVEAIPETEPNDTFEGQDTAVGTTINGFLCPGCAIADTIDFFHYTGLTPGHSFDLTFQALFQVADNTLVAARYSDQTTTIPGSEITASDSTAHLLGIVPGSGELTFGVTEGSATGFESYNLLLTTKPPTGIPGVPEPATTVLLAAGLTAAGLSVARRRKRS